MKRKGDEKDSFCSRRNKLDPIALDLKMATVTRLTTNKKKLLESSALLGGAKDRNRNEKDTSPSKLDSLPLDLKMAILIRLPGKSLMKEVRCVSKMWYSIIRSREFINSFLSMSLTRSLFIVALSNGTFSSSGEKLVFFFSFSYDKSSSLVANFEMAIPVVFHSFSSFASVHGMLVVKAGDQKMICNPCTEQVIDLPFSTRFVGYDPINNQHKALDVVCPINQNQNQNQNGYIEHKVLTLGGAQGWRHTEGTTIARYTLVSVGTCINGFAYHGAFSPARPMNPGIMCFDVRSEKLSYIKAPMDVVYWGYKSIFIEYKGKLASIVRDPYQCFHSFDLWILEDVEKHEWSKQRCVFPHSVWDSIGCRQMSFPGTNKAGEIIMAPLLLSRDVQPFYIFYYNVETKKNITRVRLLGIGDDEEFRRCYGLLLNGECYVHIAPQHVENITFFKDPPIS